MSSRIARRPAHFAIARIGKVAGTLVTAVKNRASRRNAIERENLPPGSGHWRAGAGGTRAVNDATMRIAGYTSATSVNIGEPISFHVSVEPPDDFTIEIYRLGYYGGEGARKVAESPRLRGASQAPPDIDETTGMISCRWPAAWTLTVPSGWTSGLHVAVFTTAAAWRSVTPFVVRDDARAAPLCVLLPFLTYQAYNQWPLDGVRGKSLYYGYEPADGHQPVNGHGDVAAVADPPKAKLAYLRRAYKVSFDRPYARDGLPKRFAVDHAFIRWFEASGYDATYADSMDLNSGRIDPARYAGLIFCGHDEYWSRRMRNATERAVAHGTSLAFLEANNVYWHVRIEPASDGRADRVVVCYKKAPDPAADSAGTTTQWRVRPPGPNDAEQSLLGIQYNGVVASPAPLVVQSADHWFWAGTAVADGDRIDDVVGGEADGFDSRFPTPPNVRQTLLSASPYPLRDGSQLVQNTSVYETDAGAIVFASGSNDWPAALGDEQRADKRIQIATANLLNRITRRG